MTKYQIYHKNYTELGHTYQLVLPLSLEGLVPEDDSVRLLSHELGKKLFIRHSFNIQLTEEGILLRKRAEDLINIADKITTEFLTLDDVVGGDMYLGLAESYQIRYLPTEIT